MRNPPFFERERGEGRGEEERGGERRGEGERRENFSFTLILILPTGLWGRERDVEFWKRNARKRGLGGLVVTKEGRKKKKKIGGGG